jgi:malonyl-CoA/methylmalonyl-CoA synthetase
MAEFPGPGEVDLESLDAWRAHLGREEVDPAALRASLAEGSLPDAFHRAAARFPHRPALEVDGDVVAHGELDVRAARAAGWLRANGVAPGDRVLLCGPSSIALVTAYVAILRAGAVAVPVGVTLTVHELADVVRDAKPVAAFAPGPALEAVQAVVRDVGSPTREPREPLVLSLDGEGGRTFAGAVRSGDPVALPALAGTETAVVAYTSGTTGHSKGVPLTHANLLSSIRAAMLAWRWSPDDALVHALPLSHQHGLGGVHATLLAGSRALIHDRFDPERLAEDVARSRGTVLFAVPAMYERLCASGVDPGRFSSLRLAVSGSAPLAPELAGRASALLGRFPLERYGTTESGLDVSDPYEGVRKPGSVGLALPGVELAVVGSDGSRASNGADGEIVVRGPQVFGGYARAPDDAEPTFLPGGWFRTGDIGRIDPGDAYLSITGRLKDVIISGGQNVHPREVELALEAHADVAAAGVVGVASERWGEEVTAFVVAASGCSPDPDELATHLRARLAPHKRPKRILFLDRLPVDPMGKVARADLRHLAEETDRAGAGEPADGK